MLQCLIFRAKSRFSHQTDPFAPSLGASASESRLLILSLSDPEAPAPVTQYVNLTLTPRHPMYLYDPVKHHRTMEGRKGMVETSHYLYVSTKWVAKGDYMRTDYPIDCKLSNIYVGSIFACDIP